MAPPEKRARVVLSSPPEKRARVVLSLQQKFNVIKMLEIGWTIGSVAQHYGIGRQTVVDIRKSKEKLLAFKNKGYVLGFGAVGKTAPRKTMKVAPDQALEDAVYKWFVQQRSLGVIVRNSELKAAAEKLSGHLGVKDFKASDGWLTRFRHRHGLSNQHTVKMLHSGVKTEQYLDVSSSMEEIDPKVLLDSTVETKNEFAVEELLNMQDSSEPEYCKADLPAYVKEELIMKEESLDERDMEFSRVHNTTQATTTHEEDHVECPQPQIVDIKSLTENENDMGGLNEDVADCLSYSLENAGTFHAPRARKKKAYELPQRCYRTLHSPSAGKRETNIPRDNDGTFGVPTARKQKIHEDPKVSQTSKIFKSMKKGQTFHRDKFHSYCQYVAAELREMDTHSAAHVQKLFSEIIFDARMGKFKQNNPSSS